MNPAVPFASKGLASVDSAKKYFLSFLTLRNTIPENTKTVSGIVTFYSKNLLMIVVLEMYLFRESNFSIDMCSSVTFAPKNLVSADYTCHSFLCLRGKRIEHSLQY